MKPLTHVCQDLQNLKLERKKTFCNSSSFLNLVLDGFEFRSTLEDSGHQEPFQHALEVGIGLRSPQTQEHTFQQFCRRGGRGGGGGRGRMAS